jgi:hypothetical protein
MEIRRRQVRTVRWMVKVFPTKFLQQLCRFPCSVWSCVVMKQTQTGVQIATHCAHLSFSIHFDKLAMDFGRANVFRVQKSNHRNHLTIVSGWNGSLQSTVTQNQFTRWFGRHWGLGELAEGLTTSLDLQTLPVNDLRGQGPPLMSENKLRTHTER